ncbi:hypothetical protein PILCRDRAFT_716212 [Piloderma croceum F 1598]|uniref:Uncharacterized protein n=1 Tax=Piloderma croceum (strain F 1598) TaxID=765440 RepID=A0A0C3AJ87_PILCF|nr:hypothetical protein PILCRDRAFT_716212 [Piloderma croceum F 1598]
MPSPVNCEPVTLSQLWYTTFRLFNTSSCTNYQAPRAPQCHHPLLRTSVLRHLTAFGLFNVMVQLASSSDCLFRCGIHYTTHARCPNNGSLASCARFKLQLCSSIRDLSTCHVGATWSLILESVIKRQYHMPQSFVHQRWPMPMVAGSYQFLKVESTYIFDSESIPPFLCLAYFQLTIPYFVFTT